MPEHLPRSASSAKSTPRDHLPFLDSIRGVALLSVMALHSLNAAYGFDQLPWGIWWRNFEVPHSFLFFLPITLGWKGVPIFFVISGFCIHLSHQRSSKKSWKIYFTRRFFRIYPPYLVAMLLFSFVWPWHTIHDGTLLSYQQFFSHLFLVHNFFPKTFGAINGSFWTLAIEAQLYLIYPLLLLLVQRFGWVRTLWMVGALEMGMRAFQGIYNFIHHTTDLTWVTDGNPFFYSFTLGSPLYFWFCWSIGAYTADAYLTKKALPFRGFPLWVFPTLLVIATSFKPIASFGYVFAALATVCVIAKFLQNSGNDKPGASSSSWNPLGWLGTISFSAYLLHQPIINLVPQFLAQGNLATAYPPLLRLLIVLATWIPILLISWCSYRWVELPSIALGKIVIGQLQKPKP